MFENWYAICNNSWLFDNSIKNELKILLLISSLCAEKGFCWAWNEYFSERFWETTENISRKIKKLEKFNYISCEYERNWNIISKRIIRLAIDKNITGHWQKNQSAIDKIIKENNININIINIIKDNIKDFLFLYEFIKENNKIDFIKDMKFVENWFDFLYMRNKKWKTYKPTEKAKKLSLWKLLNTSLENANKMLENSIENNWTWIFELKNNNFWKKVEVENYEKKDFLKWL